MASFRKRGNSWHVRVFKQGIIKYDSFPTKAQAVNWATQVESEILAGTFNQPSEKTFADALERYKTEVSTTKRGEHWEVIRLNAWLRLSFAYYKLHDVTTPNFSGVA